MKISVLADCHLGTGYNTRLEDDPFDNLEEALENSKDCDLILIAGDLFDSRSPRTTVWGRAISILTKPLSENSSVKLIETDKEMRKVHERMIGSIPILCLHGNHDRRVKDETNAVQALDNAGLLLHLHKNKMIFEKDGVKVAVHGMSSVAERYSKNVLDEWNPKPVEGCFNILVIHQNIDPYVYSPLEPPEIKLSDLPKGFDMILDGHIHTKALDKAGESIFMILGSTVTTQFSEKEAESIKGFHKMTFENEKKPEVEFVPIEGNRKFFYYEIETEGSDIMREEIDNLLENVASKELRKQPVVKVKIIGKDTKVVDHDIAVLKRKYSDKMILSFSKKLESVEMTEKLEFMKNMREQKLSVEEMGLNLLKNNLKEAGFSSSFSYDQIFKLLNENAVDKALAVLTGDQKVLYEIASRGKI